MYTVIVSHPESAETSPASVSFTCGFYDIPVIGISNRDSSLSNKNLHGSFMRTISPYSHQADVWIQILKRLNYHSVIFIHSSGINLVTISLCSHIFHSRCCPYFCPFTSFLFFSSFFPFSPQSYTIFF